MLKAKLIINGAKEIVIGDGVTTVGRTPENVIALSDDANISRRHAEIETRGNEFWLVELGSSNGTTVNGISLFNERLLKNGDVILLGGTSEIVFEMQPSAAAPTAPAAEKPPLEIGAIAPQMPAAASIEMPAVAAPDAAIAADVAAATPASKLPLMLAAAGLVCGLAVVCVVAAIMIGVGGSTKCEAKAKIVSPENGDTITKETEVEVEAENAECVKRAIFLIDGAEIASVEEQPFSTKLDPKQLGEYSDGADHALKIAFEDAEGNKTIQPGEVLIAFETLATPTPTPEVSETPVVANKEKPKTTGKQNSLIEIQEMSRNLLKQFAVKPNYKFDQQFLQEVQKKTAEYAVEGYFARAQNYRDLINVEFHKENGLDASFGFLAAMSRSQFKPQKQGADEGLWRLSDNFVATNNYKAGCPTESLSDAGQNCAAKTAAIYSKSLILKIFNGEILYAAAAFGMTEQEAGQWQATLPADRSDFWKAIRTAPQREQLVRFFAAGIVADNPQKFGLKNDRPISELYRNLLGG